MKKIKYLLLVFIWAACLVGCGSKGGRTLTCTNIEEQSGVSMEQKIVMNFKGNTIDYLKMSVNSTATSSLLKNNWSIFSSTLEKQFERYQSTKGITVNKRSDDSNYSYLIEIEADLNEAEESGLSTIGLDGIASKKVLMKVLKKQLNQAVLLVNNSLKLDQSSFFVCHFIFTFIFIYSKISIEEKWYYAYKRINKFRV